MHSSLLLQIPSPATPVADTAKKLAEQVAAGLPPAPVPPTEETISLLDMIMKGGLVMIPIGILSVITIYILMERIIAISRASSGGKNFMNSIRDFVMNGNMEAAKSLCKNTPGPSARMIEKGILRLGRPVKEIREAMEDVGKEEVYRLEKNLGVLSIVGRIAPMFGFIGTILGVIHIFYKISKAQDLNIGLIADGLYEKMVTSAAGLVVGVLAFAAYHVLNLWVERKVHVMESNAMNFIDLLNEPTK